MTKCDYCDWRGDPKDCKKKLEFGWVYTGRRYLACPNCGEKVVSSQVWDKSIEEWVKR